MIGMVPWSIMGSSLGGYCRKAQEVTQNEGRCRYCIFKTRVAQVPEKTSDLIGTMGVFKKTHMIFKQKEATKLISFKENTSTPFCLRCNKTLAHFFLVFLYFFYFLGFFFKYRLEWPKLGCACNILKIFFFYFLQRFFIFLDFS